jgi:hypothetical protein
MSFNLGGIPRRASRDLRPSALHGRHILLCVVSSPLQPLQLKLTYKGPWGTFLRELHRLTEHFVLRCVRFKEEGYTLLWPEFNNASDINSPRLRARFNSFRAFLEEWVSSTGIWSDGQRRTRIDVAYKAWITGGDFANRNAPLPVGFAFGFAFD